MECRAENATGMSALPQIEGAGIDLIDADTPLRLEDAVKIAFPENLGEEFDAPFARLDWWSLRSPVAPPHRRMVLSASQPYPRRSD